MSEINWKDYLEVQIEVIGDWILVWAGIQAVNLPAPVIYVITANNPNDTKLTITQNRKLQQEQTAYFIKAGFESYKNIWPTQQILVNKQRIESGLALVLPSEVSLDELLHVTRMFHQQHVYRLTPETLEVLNAVTGTVEGSCPRVVNRDDVKKTETAEEANQE